MSKYGGSGHGALRPHCTVDCVLFFSCMSGYDRGCQKRSELADLGLVSVSDHRCRRCAELPQVRHCMMRGLPAVQVATFEPPAWKICIESCGHETVQGGMLYAGVENEGAVNNRSPVGTHAAGKPSPPKHPKESLQRGGGRLSPAAAKHANDATTEEVPMTYPFVATAAGTVPVQPRRVEPHTPEAPRRMSRGTPESMSRWQAMQRSEGVDAALHAYAEDAPAVAADSCPVHGAEAGVSSGTRPLVETLVAKHARGKLVHGGEQHQSRTSSSAGERPAGSSVHDAPYSVDGLSRPPYAVLGDRGTRRDAAFGHSVPGYVASGRPGVGMSQGHRMVQPEWMHMDRPAGKPTGREVEGAHSHASHGSRGYDSLHNRDQVAKILQHNEASLRTSPGGEMFGMIDQLSRKYGDHALE